MGLLDLFRTKQPGKEVLPAKSSPIVERYATWVDPPVVPPSEEWERRLNNYARKCARQLQEAGVPLFSSNHPGGDGHYRDAFWLIACDVEWGQRSYVALPIHGLEKGDRLGHFYGDVLLLTKSGVLCCAHMDAGFPTKRGPAANDREMVARFSEIGRPKGKFQQADWGWNNQGQWRKDPSQEYSRYGSKFIAHGERFDRKPGRKTSWAEDGRDTSAALTHFVRSNGSVRWPRMFL